jgi:ubiquinol-cytochrome c reductase cytochrome b subunit
MSFLKTIGWETHLKPFFYKRLPSRTGWSAVIGTLCALNFLLLVVTGMVLAFYYVPSPEKAWDSVQFISKDVPMGSVLRGLHHWGSGTMVTLVCIHLLATYIQGSYMQPRRLTWITGVLLFLCTLGLGFTGYLLPWDMKAYWATMVASTIPAQLPGFGEYISRFFLGGDGMSGFTLTRFYAVHTLILPACVVLFMAAHIYLIRLHNLSDPRERMSGENVPPEERETCYRFYPEHINRAAAAFAALFIALLLLAAAVPAPMEDPAGTFIADYLPRPEWYYMWLFQLLTYFSGAWEIIGSLLLPIAGIVLLFAVPFLSESRIKGLVNRPIVTTVSSMCIICLAFLTAMAYVDVSPYNLTVTIPSRQLNAEEQKGLKLYVERECAYCHNILGEGGRRTGPDLSNVVRKKRSEKYLTDYIKEPARVFSASTMPSYALKEEELTYLASFLRSLDFTKGVRPVSVATETIVPGITAPKQ